MRKILLIALLAVLTACSTEIIMDQPEQRNAISVQGSTEFEVSPDLAKVRFSIETQSVNAQEAQLRNRELSDSVRRDRLPDFPKVTTPV